MDIHGEVMRAERRIGKYVRETPLEFSASLSAAGQSRTFLKFENAQITGSFKARGALNKILSLSQKERLRGIITASTGNHGLGVANALAQTGIKGVIYLPENASPAKVEALKAFRVPIEFYGRDAHETEVYARKIAVETGRIYISPYNDPQVIGGQGTIGIELLRRQPELECVFVAVGGGGLISGIGCYVKKINPAVRVLGCLPENAPAMYEAIRAGRIVPVAERSTLSDGTAGGLDADSITFGLCRKYVDDYILVREEEIAAGMRLVYERHAQIVEGAAGVAVAAFLKEKDRFRGKTCALVMCGGNIASEKFQKVVGGQYD